MSTEMLVLSLDRRDGTPLYQQIVRRIRDLIEQETLRAGARLPPTRALADLLGIDRTTVLRAYQELLALGFVESRPGSYTTVRERPKTTIAGPSSVSSVLKWDELSGAGASAVFRASLKYSPELRRDREDGVINLSRLQPDSRLTPVRAFQRCLEDVLHEAGPAALAYGEFGGFPPLREHIAHRLQLHGTAVSPDQILITNGSQHALDLILRLLVRPGSPVALEVPTYASFISLLSLFQTDIIGIPMTAQGIDVDRLQGALRTTIPAFLYTIPNFHNPTGISSNQATREALLALCERKRIPVVEDGFEEEMKYWGNVPLPIKSMDRNNSVIYIGTFSKVMFPGLRVGWIAAAGECVQRLAAINRFSELSGNTLTQMAINRFCRDGYLDKHLRVLHREFRKRMKLTLECMDRFMPDGVEWTRPEGGYTLWVNMPRSYSTEAAFKEVQRQHKVAVAPGHYFFAERCPRKYFRISISCLNETEIGEGVKRLGAALRQLLGRRN